jgi:methanogenic corrinoid protein MtbC1
MRRLYYSTLLIMALIPGVGLAKPLTGIRVLHVNAEMVRQRTDVGINDNGSNMVATDLATKGAQVRRLVPADLGPSKTAINLRALGRPDRVTISATMTESIPTTTRLVTGLVAQGIPNTHIVIGGRATSPEMAARLGVGWAPSPGPVLDALIGPPPPRRASSRQK